MTTKKNTSFKAEKPPAVVMDATPKAEDEKPKADPTRCACIGVERRWDTDGVVAPGRYQCSVCGKWYS